MANHSSLEMNKEREDMEDSKSCRCNDSFGFTKEQYNQLINLLQTQHASSTKVSLASHVTSHMTSGISRVSYSLNHSNIGSWIVDSSASNLNPKNYISFS